MSGPLLSETAALRWLPKPRQVLVDPTRLWVPVRHRDKGQPNLGVRAESFEGYPGDPWLPAIQYGWARIRVADYTWFAQITIDLRTRNRLCTKGFFGGRVPVV
ncbi:hypothetical protein [Nocardia cyriacigeorgica]|uniref:hypothetical protein n=1 Tax=Nocardia cyriacigeorgica TaxID=135487 RepID=UPI0011B05A76|nr:hypothetical protein [Nocardia cyriacigeorgica]